MFILINRFQSPWPPSFRLMTIGVLASCVEECDYTPTRRRTSPIIASAKNSVVLLLKISTLLNSEAGPINL